MSQLEFWRHLGVPERKEKELRVSMFCYDDAPLGNLLSVLATSSTPVYVLLFQGPIVNSAAVFWCYFFRNWRGVAIWPIDRAVDSILRAK